MLHSLYTRYFCPDRSRNKQPRAITPALARTCFAPSSDHIAPAPLTRVMVYRSRVRGLALASLDRVKPAQRGSSSTLAECRPPLASPPMRPGLPAAAASDAPAERRYLQRHEGPYMATSGLVHGQGEEDRERVPSSPPSPQASPHLLACMRAGSLDFRSNLQREVSRRRRVQSAHVHLFCAVNLLLARSFRVGNQSLRPNLGICEGNSSTTRAAM